MIDQSHSIKLNEIISIVLFILVQSACSSVAIYLVSRFGELYVFQYRKNIFNRLIMYPVTYFDHHKSGEISGQLINNTNFVREFYTNALPSFFTSIVLIVGSIFMLFSLDFKMAIVLLLALPLLLLILMPISKIAGTSAKNAQKSTNNVQGHMTECFREIRLIKSTTAENDMQAKVSSLLSENLSTLLKCDMVDAILNPLMLISVSTIIMGIFTYGGQRVSSGGMTTGTLVSFLIYLFQLLTPVSSIGNFISDYFKMKGSISELQQLEDLPNEFMGVSSVILAPGNNLTFKDVSFSYDDDQRNIISNISLNFRKGERPAIVGPSGSGKTTVINLIERFYSPLRGEISLDDENISSFPLSEWRKMIGIISQESQVVSGTILENLCLGFQTIPKESKIIDVLTKVSLLDEIQNLPNGLHTKIEEAGVNLSGGQLQRLQIARTILKNPEIIIMDEATSNLDSNSEKIITEVIKKLAPPKIIVTIAHRLSTISDYDSIIFLDNGQISGAGTHEKLLHTHVKYKKFVENQLLSIEN